MHAIVPKQLLATASLHVQSTELRRKKRRKITATALNRSHFLPSTCSAMEVTMNGRRKMSRRFFEICKFNLIFVHRYFWFTIDPFADRIGWYFVLIAFWLRLMGNLSTILYEQNIRFDVYPRLPVYEFVWHQSRTHWFRAQQSMIWKRKSLAFVLPNLLRHSSSFRFYLYSKLICNN